MGDILGILINEKKLKHKELEFYHKYGASLGVQVCFLTAKGLDFQEHKAKVYCFDSEKKLQTRTMPIPRVIYNQSRHLKLDAIRKIRKLRNDSNVVVFNPSSSFTWTNMYRILQTDHELVQHLLFVDKDKIPYPSFQGNPFYLVLTLQRDLRGEWCTTGMIARIFNPDYFPLDKDIKSTSIKSLQSSRDLILSEDKLELIECFGAQAATILEKFIPNLAELCFSFILDDSGTPVLFDGGLRNRRNWLKQAGEICMWEESLRKPIEYGCSLLKKIEILCD